MIPTWQILVGDVREQLRTLPDQSVHCVVTSPPYWGLRDYGVEGQIGLERTPDDYVAGMVDVFREVRRVLRDDGTLWLNLGDSYANDTKWGGSTGGKHTVELHGAGGLGRNKRDTGLKPKELVGIPWRVAFALQADGWYLRADIVWSKPNPMPESVMDRPTKAHEYVFLLAKSEAYFYDAVAIFESVAGTEHSRGSGVNPKARANEPGAGVKQNASFSGAVNGLVAVRNRRTVWQIQTQPYPGAHFATFPEALPDLCIRAGTSERGACPDCGAPYERIVEKGAALVDQQKACGGDADGGYDGQATKAYEGTGAQNASDVKRRILEGMRERLTLGWRPACGCAIGCPDEPDAFEYIETPTGEGGQEDRSLEVGRAGMARERNDDEGRRLMTRYEQRRYAQQLRRSPHRAEMSAEAGVEAFKHYRRTDRSGARAIPPELLDAWLARGWLQRVELPEPKPLEPVPCVVLDPFNGSGTTGAVAVGLGRSYKGCELKPEYAEMGRRRIRAVASLMAQEVEATA